MSFISKIAIIHEALLHGRALVLWGKHSHQTAAVDSPLRQISFSECSSPIFPLFMFLP